jgi:methionyl-tRNA formyltransferase
MRIVMMGTSDFAVPCLQRLMEHQYDVAAVVTQPDRPKGRKRQLTPPPLKEAALAYQLPVLQPEKLRESSALAEVLAYKPDLIVTAAYGQLLPEALLSAPKYGCINVHASLLPKYRGGAPIHWAIIRGEAKTGLTIMYMVKQLDAGDILTQVEVPISDDDNVATLHDKLSRAGAELLTETIPHLIRGEITPLTQDEEEATYAPNIRPEDEIIDWNRTAREVYNLIRGLSPWPVASTYWSGQRVKIWGARLLAEHTTKGTPGTILNVSDAGIDIAAGNGVVRVTSLQPAGKKVMDAKTFINGNTVHIGEVWGRV